MIGVIIGLVLMVCFYGMVMCKAADKKQPKPGQDFDERGPY